MLYADHGAALFRLAHAICGDDELAADAVGAAIASAVEAGQPDQRPLRELARATFRACTELVEDPAPQRALLALTLWGDHTYDDAAALLRLSPATAAQVLRTTLLEVARDRSPGGPQGWW